MTAGVLWPGTWTRDHLGLGLTEAAGQGGLRVSDLAGLAVRNNPRRAQLVVSGVLGKHVPVDPRLAAAAGRLLAWRVAGLLSGATRSADRRWESFGRALHGDTRSFGELTFGAADAAPADPFLVLGYAETATALGHLVADGFAASEYLHTTRRPAHAYASLERFEEIHSHATEHLIQPTDRELLDRGDTAVLVDDELTTGRTAAATIGALHRRKPRSRYVVAALVDLRTDADVQLLAAKAAAVGTHIDVVALASASLSAPSDVDDRARRICEVAQLAADPVSGPAAPVWETAAPWPTGLPQGGRHGFTAAHRGSFDDAVAVLADRLADGLPTRGRVLVLGTEEFMYVPLRAALELTKRRNDPVLFSSTTRSPAIPVDEPGYAIRTRLTFPDPEGGASPRHAYNVAAGRHGSAFDHIVVMVDHAAQRPLLRQPGGLVDVVSRVCGGVTLMALPAWADRPRVRVAAS